MRPYRDPLLFKAHGPQLPTQGHVGIAGYPRALERSVPEPEHAIAHVRSLRDRFGPRAVVWRYDPIVVTTVTPPDWHVANLDRLAAALAGATGEVVVSFVEPYRKTARNPPDDEKRDLAARLAAVAAGHGMALTLCTQPALTGGAPDRPPTLPGPRPGG